MRREGKNRGGRKKEKVERAAGRDLLEGAEILRLRGAHAGCTLFIEDTQRPQRALPISGQQSC